MLKIILVQGFCPVKSKITQFPNGSGLNTKFILVVSKLLRATLPNNRVRGGTRLEKWTPCYFVQR